MTNNNIRNIAIIAHVDHGKTTLVDGLLKQSGTFRANQQVEECVMDSNPLERERGITILAKNTAVDFNGVHINIVDTPGHADFGGEVERILKMVDSALVLVDAVDGPMPQTKFVVSKALKLGLKPIVVINKIDRDGARPNIVVDLTFDLFCQLGATDEQLDFPIIYASARNGYAIKNLTDPKENLIPLFETIISHVQPPNGNPDAPLQMLVTSLEYDNYIGRIAIGKISNGQINIGSQVVRIKRDGSIQKSKVTNLLGFQGLNRFALEKASAGEIIAVAGLEEIEIGETISNAENPVQLPPIDIDEPTLNVEFLVNNSPFAGKEGKFVTSRHLRARLFRELRTNIALKVEETENADIFKVSGRGELHLAILMETMRREGYEFAVSKPEVILKKVNEQLLEPYEQLTVDVDSQYQGIVIEKLGMRKGEMLNMNTGTDNRIRMEYKVPARSLIGLQTELMTETKGTCIMHHIFDSYGPFKGEIPSRKNGVLISMDEGEITGYALYNLVDRGKFFIDPGTKTYEGMVIGIHAKDNDLVVNPMKAKKLTNMRASGSDDGITLPPALSLTLEQALEFIAEDELVEITPKSIRVRKKILDENQRKQKKAV